MAEQQAQGKAGKKATDGQELRSFTRPEGYKPRLKTAYEDKIKAALREKF